LQTVGEDQKIGVLGATRFSPIHALPETLIFISDRFFETVI
jgi:hypothetical protein